MDPHAQEPVERLRRATAAAMRALAQSAELSLVFAPEGPSLTGTLARLPVPSVEDGRAGIAKLRGEADSMALLQRHHDAALHARLAPAERRARMVFDALERVRVDALG